MTADPFDWLFGLSQFGIKFGLHNIRSLVAELGHPERRFRSVHVAGTNGKGSVTAMVETALRRAGMKTGRYTSPHLLDLAERFAIDGRPVEQDALRAVVQTVRHAVDRLRDSGTLEVHPTFFEVTTAVAFELFADHKVDVAVCEVGLGGRLDATNVLSPMACAITSIALDHEQYLGHTTADIAAEKAGILKEGVPVVVGPVDADAARTIAAVADQVHAPLVWAMSGCDVGGSRSEPHGGQRFAFKTPARDYGHLYLALNGEHQVTNAVVAVRLLEQLETSGLAIGERSIAEGLASVEWPGRLQQIALPDGRDLLLDAAHNPAGAATLARYLKSLGPPRPLIFGVMRDKDVRTILRELLPTVSSVVVTRATNPRSAEPDDVAALVRDLKPSVPVEVAATPGGALQQAWSRSPHVVVAGSIFLLADVMKELGRP